VPITPLPQFEADVAELERERRIEALVEKGFSRADLEGLTGDDLEAFEKKKPPRTLVVRFGSMYLIGEYPYSGDVTPGCGSKMVVRTHRGTEVGELLTSTCPNAGCSKSVSRHEMLEYIENSGGRDFPFYTDGRVLRVATAEDLDKQAALEQEKHALKLEARCIADSLRLNLKVVEVEPILGGERMTVYYTADQRVDHRALARAMSSRHRVRVDTRSVGARDEARLTADYEKCGQYCCCKNFLKVLKPVSMKSAKVQKATLDPLKISGRCGRLMCCLRYEDSTYEDLRKRLPNRKRRVGTPDGDGIVVDTQILTQLVLVELDGGERAAFPVEEIAAPGERPASAGAERERSPAGKKDRRPRSEPPTAKRPDPARGEETTRSETTAGHSADSPGEPGGPSVQEEGQPAAPKKKRRRRRKKPASGDASSARDGGRPAGDDAPESEPGDAPKNGPSDPPAQGGDQESAAGPAKKKRRRRRRKPRPGGDGSGGENA